MKQIRKHKRIDSQVDRTAVMRRKSITDRIEKAASDDWVGRRQVEKKKRKKKRINNLLHKYSNNRFIVTKNK